MHAFLQQYIQSKVKISPEEWEGISSFFKPVHFRRRQMVLQEGEIAQKLFLVVEGCLRMYLTDEHLQEYIQQFAISGWWITDRESAFSGKPSLYNIDAVEDTDALELDMQDYYSLKVRFLVFEQLMEQVQFNNMVATQKRITAAISYTAEQKYDDFVQRYPEIVRRVPLHMIASYLGITPETLSRIRRKRG